MNKKMIDAEIYNIIYQMCDISLKTGGIKNKNGVDMVLDYFEPEQPKEEEINPDEGKRI
jgi:hypothetical protein